MDSIYREAGKKCKLTLSKTNFNVVYSVAQILAKHSPYSKAINDRLKKCNIR